METDFRILVSAGCDSVISPRFLLFMDSVNTTTLWGCCGLGVCVPSPDLCVEILTPKGDGIKWAEPLGGVIRVETS